ncbi:MAG: NAD(P)H-dependent glycerol-3-phosphate dehydrogenase [bacterium]
MNNPVATAVLGAGSWGTALAIHLASNGHPVKLWGHLPEAAQALNRDRENQHYLPGIKFPEPLTATADLGEAIQDAEHVIVVVPSHAFAEVLESVKALQPGLERICWATKGLAPGNYQLLHEVAAQVMPNTHLAVLSGPTFASEVARGLPTAITAASTDSVYAEELAEHFHGDNFRVYTADDMVGVQLGGAAKNVMAIAAGISDGLGFGANARAALITRGLAEITRLGLALGGRPETFMGLAGMGDLVLTCTDDQSRNRRMGLALARDVSMAQAKKDIGQEVEGVAAAGAIKTLADQHGIDMPITHEVHAVLHEGKDAHEAVHTLLARHQRAERE